MKYIPRKKYGFEKMKVGESKRIPISSSGREGIQALTAAYAFARRHNEKLSATSKKRIQFSGRRSDTGKYMMIYRIK